MALDFALTERHGVDHPVIVNAKQCESIYQLGFSISCPLLQRFRDPYDDAIFTNDEVRTLKTSIETALRQSLDRSLTLLLKDISELFDKALELNTGIEGLGD